MYSADYPNRNVHAGFIIIIKHYVSQTFKKDYLQVKKIVIEDIFDSLIFNHDVIKFVTSLSTDMV